MDYQAMLDAGGVIDLPTGTFDISRPLTAKPGTTLIAPWRGGHILRKAPDFPADKPMLTVVGSADAKGFSMQHVTVDGGDLPTDAELVACINCDDVLMLDCELRRGRYMLVALNTCALATVVDCVLVDWGRREETAEGGAAIWTQDCDDLSITRNLFQDGEWSCLYLGGHRPSVCDNRVLRCKESAFFGGPIGGTFSGNTILDQGFKHAAGHGFEIGGSDNLVVGNRVERTAGESLHIAGENFRVAGNSFAAPGRDTGHFPGSSCIGVLSYKDTDIDLHPRGLTIADNDLDMADAAYGVLLARQAIPVSAKISDTMVRNNRYFGSGKLIACLPSMADVCGDNVILETT